jgi:hypothetical protein
MAKVIFDAAAALSEEEMAILEAVASWGPPTATVTVARSRGPRPKIELTLRGYPEGGDGTESFPSVLDAASHLEALARGELLAG